MSEVQRRLRGNGARAAAQIDLYEGTMSREVFDPAVDEDAAQLMLETMSDEQLASYALLFAKTPLERSLAAAPAHYLDELG